MTVKSIKDFLTSDEYKTKWSNLVRGIFMVVLGCYFVIPYFGMLGVFWTIFSAIYTAIVIVKIVMKANDGDAVSLEIQSREARYGDIEGEKEDVDTTVDGKPRNDGIDDYNQYRLMKLADDYNNGRISEQEFNAERAKILQNYK